MMENIPEDTVENIQKLFDSFLWDEKKNKIKSNIMCQEIGQGGLKTTNVKVFVDSQKCAWINRLCDPNNKAKWTLFSKAKAQQICGTSDFKMIFNFNLNPRDIKNMFGNSFLSNLLRTWSQYHFNDTPQLSQIIWFNSAIKVDNKPLKCHQMMKQNLVHFNDLIVNDVFIDQNLLRRLNIKMNYLNFLTLKTAIKEAFKKATETPCVNVNPISQKLLFQKNVKSSKAVYDWVIFNKIRPEGALEGISQYWEKNIETLEGSEDWNFIITNAYKSLFSSKLRTFAFKFIHHIVFSDLRLYKCGHRNSSLCSLCGHDVGDFIHIFWQCRTTMNLITDINVWYNSTFNVNISFSKEKFLIGSKSQNCRLDSFTEAFLWYIKWFIHCRRFDEAPKTLQFFITFIRDIEKLERTIAIQKNCIPQHERKWFNFLRSQSTA